MHMIILVTIHHSLTWREESGQRAFTSIFEGEVYLKPKFEGAPLFKVLLAIPSVMRFHMLPPSDFIFIMMQILYSSVQLDFL